MLDKDREKELRDGIKRKMVEEGCFLSLFDQEVLDIALESVLEKPHPNGLFTVREIKRGFSDKGEKQPETDFIWNSLKRAEKIDLVACLVDSLGDSSVFAMLIPKNTAKKGE